MLKREEKESMKVKRTICLLLTFMMVLSSFSTAFAANGIMSNGQQQEPSEAIRNYANKAVKLYRYMTQDERAVIKTTKTKLENLNTDDSLWASVLNGLLTEKVTERFGNEGQARSALKELVSDVLMIQFLPSTQDVDDLVQEIENIKNENKDNIERLLNPDSDIQITVDAFVDYLCETAETYTSPEYIKNSGYAHILSEGTNQQVVTTLHTMIKNIIKDEINQDSEIAKQIRALGWDADRLHSSFKLLKDNIKDEGNNNLAEKSELILFKAAIRTQADLYKMTVMDDEVIGETAVDLTYAEGSDRIHGITYYDLRVLEKSYNGSIGVEADSDVVTVEYEIIGAQREFVKITPKSGISDGQCTLIFYRDPLSQGIPEDDWIVKLNVTIDTVNVPNYNVSVNKTEVQRGENIIITGTGPIGKSVIVWVRDKNGATKYTGTEVIDPDGKFSLTLKLGDSWEEGEYTVYVGEGTNTAQTTFRVREKEIVSYTVQVNKAEVQPGESITITGTGPVGKSIIIWVRDKNGATQYTGTEVIDPDGKFSLTLTIGDSWEEGEYTVYVGEGTNTDQTTFRVRIKEVVSYTVQVNKTEVQRGENIIITGTGPVGKSVIVLVRDKNGATKYNSAEVIDSDGKFSLTLKIGDSWEEGEYTVYVGEGTNTAQATFHVKTTTGIVPVEKVFLNKSELTLAVGQTEQLIATIEPENATNKNVSWSSSDEEVATVDEDGTVRAVGAGTATITVTTEDGNKTATCTVTVTLPSEKKIISFTIPGQIGETIIDHDKHTIKVFVPRGTDKTKLVPTISVSEGATVSPASGVEVDFTSQVTYTVTAADGSTQPYTVIVTEPILITNQETTVDNENPVVEIPSTDIGEENIVIRIPEDVKNPVIVIDIPEDSSSEIQNVTIDAAAGTTPVIYVVKRPLSGTNENEVEVELPLAINVVMHGFSEELDSVEITIPQGTVITANKEWDGNISLPQLVGSAERKQTVQQKIEQAPENTNKAKVKELDVIQIGSSALEIKFDQPIRLLFKDKAKNNKKIKLGYIDENDNFIPITFILSSDETEKVAEELEENQKREGWLIVRNDVVVWTTHFTEYVVYVENEAPVAQGVNISGSLRVGQTLTGSYRYADLENDAEGDTELRWYRASSQTGKDKQLISTGTNKYKLTSSDKGMYIFFEVIPKAKTGTEIGEPNIAIRGPILAQSGGSGSSGTGSSKTIVMTPVEVSLPQDVIGHWAQDYIRELMERQAVSGYPDGTFRPNANITRAEFATILVKALNLQPRAGKVFNDTVNHWAKDVISTAHAHGIINGYDDNTFGPDDYITREQMAVMIARAAGLYNAAAGTQFADSNTFSEWAVNAIAAISEKGIITGYPDGTFKPKNYATRAEAATVITKILKYLNK